MTSAESMQRIDKYWIDQLGISPDALQSRRLLVLPLAEPSAFSCLVFQHGAFTCVRVPRSLYEQLHQSIGAEDPAALVTPAWWQAALTPAPQRIVGPAYLGYADALQFRPATPHPARLLTPADAAALEAFAGAVGPLAWEHSGLGRQPQPIVACWEQGQVVAAAGYTLWGDALAHIGVTTHPDFRGSGYGRSVVSAIGQHALEQGHILQYRTLLANTPSIAIAAALGFQVYATTLFIALEIVPDS